MKQRVLVAMSGGVDSSVAALMMKQQGYEVIGAFMKNWSDTKNDLGECTWRGERRMAQKVAAILNIPLKTLDFEKQYRKLVVEEMYKKYRQGITPNPDIDCNEKVKFPLLIKAAKKFKCDFLVTGHYARIKKVEIKNDKSDKSNKKSKKNSVLITKDKYANVNGPNRWGGEQLHDVIQKRVGLREGGNKFQYQLLRAKDELKDQSYFLYRTKQNELAKTLFPIGELTKIEVREIAKKHKFPNFDKKSTVGICFIGKVNLKKFLQKKIKSKQGKILNPEGKQIGKHDGIFYYTIGQRIGSRFGIEVEKKDKESMKKWYVARKILKTNTIIAAPEGHPLNYRKEIYVNNVHWISDNPLITHTNSSKKDILISKSKSVSKANLSQGGWVGKPLKVFSRIRQVGELLPSKTSLNKGKIKITLNKPIIGVSEGQAIVLYKGKECLGGGVISFT